MNQNELLASFNKSSRQPFNNNLFKRDNMDMVSAVIKSIYSCERYGSFVFKVHKWELITDYDVIRGLLKDYENKLKKGKNRKKINQYEYIDLKDSDYWLLSVEFYFKYKEEEGIIPIYLQIPIYRNKYYFYLGGNFYLPMLQIADGSTFNSSTSKNSGSPCVTLKTDTQSLKVYKNIYDIHTYQQENVPVTYFTMTAFGKSLSVFWYMLAKKGLYETLNFFGMYYIRFSKTPQNLADDWYCFETNNGYISVPKQLYSDQVVQSLICSLVITMNDKSFKKFEDIFKPNFWAEYLGSKFSSRCKEAKGYSVLESLEGSYDISIHEELRLPEEAKSTVYHILKWIIGNYQELLERSNLDIGYKRIKLEEYIASYVSMKLADIVRRYSEVGTNLNYDLASKYMRGLKPSFLIDSMTTCKFINCKNSVSDVDTFKAIKFTMLTLPGLDDKNKNPTLGNIYRHIHPSHLGRLDLDSSPKAQVGIAGTLTAFCHLEDDGFFSDYQEPNSWDERYEKLLTDYKKAAGVKEAFMIRERITGVSTEKKKIDKINEDLDYLRKVIAPQASIAQRARYSPVNRIVPIEESGRLYIQY